MDINFYINFHLNIWLTLYLLGYVYLLFNFVKEEFPTDKSFIINCFEFLLASIFVLWYPMIPIFALLGFDAEY